MAEAGRKPPRGMTVSVVGTIYCGCCGMHMNVTPDERQGRRRWVAMCLNSECDAYKRRYGVVWPKAELGLLGDVDGVGLREDGDAETAARR